MFVHIKYDFRNVLRVQRIIIIFLYAYNVQKFDIKIKFC